MHRDWREKYPVLFFSFKRRLKAEILYVLVMRNHTMNKKGEIKTKTSSDEDWKRLEKWKIGRANYP